MLGPEHVFKDVVRWFLTRRMVAGIDLKNNVEQVCNEENKDYPCFHREEE